MLKTGEFFGLIFNFLFVSYPAAFTAHRKIKKQIEGIRESDFEIDLDYEKLSLDLLRRHLEKCRENKNLIESKAKQNLFGVSLAFSIIFASFGLMISDSSKSIFNGIYTLVLIPAMVGILFLLVGGFAAQRALRIGEWYDLSLKEEVNFLNSISQKKEIVIELPNR